MSHFSSTLMESSAPDEHIVEALFHPRLLLHPQRLKTITKEMLGYLPPSYREKRDRLFYGFCHRVIRHRYRISLPLKWPSPEAVYLLALGFSHLETLFLRAGLCLLYPRLLMIIDGHRLRFINQSIGDDNDAFLWAHANGWFATLSMDFISKDHTTALGRWFILNKLSDDIEGRNHVRLRSSPCYDTIPLGVPKTWRLPSKKMTVDHLMFLIKKEEPTEKGQNTEAKITHKITEKTAKKETN